MYICLLLLLNNIPQYLVIENNDFTIIRDSVGQEFQHNVAYFCFMMSGPSAGKT